MQSKPHRSVWLNRRTKDNGAFTLVEMLIVFALIALVAALAIGALGNIFSGGQVDAARLFVNTSLKAPLTKYRLDTGSYPTTEEGLAALLSAPSGKESRWRGPYVETEMVDPWQRPYQYRYPGTRNPLGARGYDVWSQGENPDSEEDDIGNWK